MKVDLVVNNVNTKIVGDLNNIVLADLVLALCYKTEEYNGYNFVDVEHNLFNRVTQSFPTGLYSKVTEVLQENNINYDTIDKRISPNKIKPLKLHDVEPYDFQDELIDTAIENQRFVVQVATGGGKTVIGAGILAKLNMTSIFVVHTGDLFEQAYDELSRMLKVPIGRIGGGICDIQKINVCMIQSIHAALGKEYKPFDDVEKEFMRDDDIVKKSTIRNSKIIDFLKTVKVILIDECHHLRADSYIETMKACKNAFFRGGLCLHRNTKIQMADGRECNISSLFNFASKNNSERIVDVTVFNLSKQIFENKKAKIIRTSAKNKTLYQIKVRNYLNEIIEIICSSKHKFFNYDTKHFVEAKDLVVGDNLFTIEKLKRYCLHCKREIILRSCRDKRKYCNNDCKLQAVNKLRNEKFLEWWKNASESDISRYKELGRKRYERINKKWQTMSDEDRLKISKQMSDIQKNWKKRDPENFYKAKKVGMTNFVDPQRISKHLKKVWASYTEDEKKARYRNRIRAGLKSQEKMRKIGEMRFKGCMTIAEDGHKCDSKSEAVVDNWLFKNNIKHELHPFIENTTRIADFSVECNFQKVYIEYDGLNRGENYDKIKLYEELNLNYIILDKSRRKLNNEYLMSKLSFLLLNDPPAKIESIKKIKNKEKYLYDLKILDDDENCHNFFANSILVHNSATPESGDGKDIILQAYSGKIIGRITASYLIKRGLLVRPTCYLLNGNLVDKYRFSRQRYNSIYKKYIVNNKFRNKKIVECVDRFQELDKTVLITVTTKKHGQLLQKMIRDNGHECEFIYSGVDRLQRKVHINNVRQRKLKIIIGTSLADEGLNIPALDALILAGGGKSPTRMRQRIGRVLRLAKGKKEAIVVDFKDNVRYLLGHFKKRKEMCESESEFKIVESFT